MDPWMQIVLGLVGGIILFSTALHLTCWAARPELVYKLQQRNGSPIFIATCLIALLGAGIVIFAGIHLFLFWMPSSWGFIDGEHEWMSYREYVASAGGMMGALAISKVWSESVTMLGWRRYSDTIADNLPEFADALTFEGKWKAEALSKRLEKRIERLSEEWPGITQIKINGIRPAEQSEVEALNALIGHLRSHIETVQRKTLTPAQHA